MSKTIEQQAAEVIAEQVRLHEQYVAEEDEAEEFDAPWCVEQLRRAGLLAPDLPEANGPGTVFVPDGKGWLLENEDTGPRGPLVWTAPGSLVMIQRIEPGELVPIDARKFALNILAAAEHAESTGKDVEDGQ